MTEIKTKECDACLEEKTLNNFYLNKGTPRSKCKNCYSKQVLKNPKKNLHAIKYYEKNRDYCMKVMRVYQIKNKTGAEICY